MNQVDLSGLKDIHIPVQPDWWPLAMGWYVLFAGLIILFCLCCLIYKWYQNRPRPYALKELKKIQQTCPEQQIKKISQLLKRVAIVRYGRESVAPLSENTWETFLLSVGPHILSPEQAHILAFSIYDFSLQRVDFKLLYKNCQLWIKQVLR